jgi:Tol biopolymer transport system component
LEEIMSLFPLGKWFRAYKSSFLAKRAGTKRGSDRSRRSRRTLERQLELLEDRLAPAMVFTTAAQTLTAGYQPSALMTVLLENDQGQIVKAGSGGVTLNLSSTSSQGFFLDSAGKRLSSPSITIGPGSSTGSFEYEDTSPGTPTLTVTATGFGPATQQETVKAPNLVIYGRVDGTIWQAALDGSSDQQITTGSEPRLSPDGRYLIFHRGTDPNPTRRDLYERDILTGQETRVFANNDYDVNYSFTADSSQIVFDYYVYIEEMNRDGSNAHIFLQGSDAYDDAPSVNPHNSTVAFHNIHVGLLTCKSDGSGRLQIPNTQPGDLFPTWSPDGQWISFERGNPSLYNSAKSIYDIPGFNLFKIHPDGTGLTQLTFVTNLTSQGFGPTAPWTADGKAVVAQGTTATGQGLYLIASDGSGTMNRLATSTGAAVEFAGTVEGSAAPSAPVLQSLSVTPANPTVAKGLTQQFTVTGTFSDGTQQDETTAVTWSSGTPAAATINSAGLASVPANATIGATTNITATLGTVSGQTTLTVGTLQSLSVIYSRADGTIWQASLDGSSDQKITTGSDPRLSPDGRYLVFHRGTDPNPARRDTYERDMLTGQETRIFANNDYQVSYAFTADSSQIVFDYYVNIWEMNRDGSSVRNLLQGADAYDDAPSLNPTNGELAFHNENQGLFLANADGSGRLQIPNTKPGDLWPAWSTDGQWISFEHGQLYNSVNTFQTTGFNLYKIHPDGTGLTQLTFASNLTSQGFGSGIAWTADGKGVVAQGTTASGQGLYLIAGDGSGTITPLATSSGAAADWVGTVRGTTTSQAAPAITSGNSATFTIGSNGSFTVQSTGAPVPSLSVTGSLPAGVTFTDNHDGTATIGGTPTGNGGHYTFTITAHNGVGSDANQNFTLTVNQAAAITSGSTPPFISGSSGSFTVHTTGFPAPTLSESGALPSGVTFTDNHDGTATISGTPAAGTFGSYGLTITAHNGIGSDATQHLTLTVSSLTNFVVYGRADGTIWKAALDGSYDVHIADGYSPRLSPDGRYLVFHQSDLNSGTELVEDLTTGASTAIPNPNSDVYHIDISYTWTNDGSQIILDSGVNGGFYDWPIGSASAPQHLSDTGQAPAMSPPLYYGQLAYHDRYRGLLINTAPSFAGPGILIPNTQPGDLFPTWSPSLPDGEWIAFERDVHGSGFPFTYGTTGRNIYKIHLDGTGLTQLTFATDLTTQGFGPGGDWTADGRYFVALHTTAAGQGLVLIAADGSGTITPLATSSGAAVDWVGTVRGNAPESPVLQSLSVTPANATVAKGLTQQFTVTGTFSDGSTRDETANVTWASSNSSAATINSAGVVSVPTAATVGATASITATLGTINGNTTLTVGAAILQGLTVTGASTCPKGLSTSFTATGTFSDGSAQDETAQVTWHSSNPAAATINAAGLASVPATAVTGMTTLIRATLGTLSNGIFLTVGAATLQSLSITPANPTVAEGLTQQFTATGTFSDGSTQDETNAVAWSSGTAGVATISSTGGLASAVNPGTTQITATLTGITGATTLTVTAPPINLTAPPLPTGTVGDSYSFTIGARGGSGSYMFAETGDLDGLTLAPTGLLSGGPAVAGAFSILVTATDSSGGTGSQRYTLNINPAITLTAPPLPTGIQGDPYSFQLKANGGAGSPYMFTSHGSLDGLNLSSSGLLHGTPAATGSFLIQVMATDSNGGYGRVGYNLTVIDVPHVTVSGPRTTLLNQPIHFLTPGRPAVPEITIADGDIGLGLIQVTLHAGHGTLGLGYSTHLSNMQGANTGNLQFTGLLVDVNAALASLVYTPNHDYAGPDGLQVQMVAPDNTATATVPITVIANDVPAITVPAPQTISNKEQLPLYVASGSQHTAAIGITDADIGSAKLQLTLRVDKGKLQVMTKDAEHTVQVDDTLQAIGRLLATLTYIPAAGYIGGDVLHIQVVDKGNPPPKVDTVTASADLSITVVENDAPVITVPLPQTTLKDRPLPFFVRGVPEIRITDGDIGLAKLQLNLSVDHGTLQATTKDAKGNPVYLSEPTIQVDDTLQAIRDLLATLQYTPATGYAGGDALHIQVVDKGRNPRKDDTVTASADLSITVVANDVPVITVPPPQTALKDTPLTLSVHGIPEIRITDGDIGGGRLQLTLSVDHGELQAITRDKRGDPVPISRPTVQVDGTLLAIRDVLATLGYTPTRGYNGGDILHIQVVDPGNPPGGADSVTATRDLPINTVANDVPSINAPGQLTIIPGSRRVFGPLLQIGDRDIGKGMLYVVLQVDHGHLGGVKGPSLLELHGTLADLNRQLAALSYVPDKGYAGPDTLYIEVVDPGNPVDPLTAVTAYQTVQITVV